MVNWKEALERKGLNYNLIYPMLLYEVDILQKYNWMRHIIRLSVDFERYEIPRRLNVVDCKPQKVQVIEGVYGELPRQLKVQHKAARTLIRTFHPKDVFICNEREPKLRVYGVIHLCN